VYVGSETLVTCSNPLQDDDEEQEEAAEVAEKVDPVSETEEPSDDVDSCVVTGYADNSIVGTVEAARH